MLRSPAPGATRKGAFAIPGAMLALAALVLVALTFAEWRAMAFSALAEPNPLHDVSLMPCWRSMSRVLAA